MDTIRFELKPALLVISSVILVELAVPLVTQNPILATGLARLADIIIILGIFFLFRDSAYIAGMRRNEIMGGLLKGMAWSAIFGVIAGICGVILLLLNINPASLVHSSLPKPYSALIRFLLIAGIVGPVAEELFFRGVCFAFFRQWGFLPAMAVSTALFVWAHQAKTGIPIPQLTGGIVFAWAYEREKNIIVPMVIHCIGNLAIFGISYL